MRYHKSYPRSRNDRLIECGQYHDCQRDDEGYFGIRIKASVSVSMSGLDLEIKDKVSNGY